MKLIVACVVALIPLYGSSCFAQLSQEHEKCFDQASNRYSIEKKILKAIAKTESNFKENVISKPNKNATYDIGMMQINSSWLPTLLRFGITQSSLLNACTNIHVGAWILAHNFASHGHSWKAIGAYNSPTPENQAIYARKVYANYARLD